MKDNKVIFEDGQLVNKGYVKIGETKYEVVEAEYSGNTPLSAHMINLVQDRLRDNIKLNEDNIKLNENNIGTNINTYNQNNTYSVGDIAIFENQLYKCTTSITEAEEYEPSHWAKTSLKEMIGNTNNRINNMLATEISNHSGKVRIGDMLIQYGEINITTPSSGAANHTLTFPVAFSTTPAVYITSKGNYNTHAQANNINTTSMILRCRSLDGSEHEGRTFDWLAIGKAVDIADNYSETEGETTIEELEEKINEISNILVNCIKSTEYNEFKNSVYKKTESYSKTEIDNLFESIETNIETEQIEQSTSINNNTAEITKLKKENEELVQLMPWKTTEIAESIHVEDSAKYSKNKLNMFGNLTESLANDTQEKSPDNPATISNVTGVQKIRRYGKNLLDLSGLADTYSYGGLTFNKISEGVFNIKGTKTSTSWVHYKTDFTIPQCWLNKSITLYFNKDLRGKSVSGNVGFKKGTGTSYFWVNFSQNSNTAIITQEMIDNVNTFDVGIQTTASDIDVDIKVYALLTDEIDTTFEEYKKEEVLELNLGNIELAKIEDTNGNTLAQDRIVKRNINDIWKWQIEENVEKVLFNGTELWRASFVNNSVDTVRFAKQLNNISTSGSKSYNNLFKTRISESHTDTEYLYMPSDTIYINVNKNRLSGETIEAFQTWLSSNNLKVYYKALEAKYTDCSAELSQQLDKLYELQLEKDTNNILIESTNNVTAEMQLEYVQDINAKYKTLADRITALENA